MKNKEIVNFIFSPLAKSLTLPDDNYKYFALYSDNTCVSILMSHQYVPLFPNKWASKQFLRFLEKNQLNNIRADTLGSKVLPKLINEGIPVLLTNICFDEEYEDFAEGIIYKKGPVQTRIIVTEKE